MYGADGSIVFDINSSGNLEFGTTTGSIFGTATNQKLSFWNATPIAQPSGDVLTALENLGLISSPSLSGLSASAVGTINLWASSTVPDGWILCDGSSLLRTGTYAGLFAVIGTTYGTADGTHFNVPNFKGKVPVGYNSAETEFNAMGKTGGEKTHTLTIAEMPAHTHTPPWDAVAWQAGALGFTSGGGNVIGATGNTGATGGSGAHNNLQPYLTLNYIIKYAGAALPDSGLIVTSPLSGSGTTASPLTADLTRIKPASDSTTAVQINKANGTTNVLNVDTTNGRVGIGTTSPANPLTVQGTNRNVMQLSSGGASAQTFIEMLQGGKTWQVGNHDNFSNYTDWGIRNATDNIPAFNITAAGNIGIGTAAPRAKLNVMGTIQIGGDTGSTGSTAVYLGKLCGGCNNGCSNLSDGYLGWDDAHDTLQGADVIGKDDGFDASCYLHGGVHNIYCGSINDGYCYPIIFSIRF